MSDAERAVGESTNFEWVRGDALGLPIPAHRAALEAGGEAFLTEAFRTTGAIAAHNRVNRITRLEECPGGSTGRKLLLSVEYAHPSSALPTDLFVKFSRDFDDPIRDRAKNQLESEVRLALLSRSPDFPIVVPLCLFADYHRNSGTGILVTQRIAFGTGGIEPLYEKCRDHEMPDPLAHYKALLKTVAGLAGAHKGGRLAANIAQQFPFDATQAIATDRIRYTEQQLLNRVARFAEFGAKYPQLFPRHIATPEFIAQLRADVPRFLLHEPAIKRFLFAKPEFIALCHWNANVDNAWFWHNAQGELECGLMDWGRVGQMSVALALFGCLSAAAMELWDRHLIELLDIFVTEFHRSGGPPIDVAELKLHLLLFIAMMGLAWLMDAPALVQAQFADLSAIESPLDPRFAANETARVQLHMFTTVMNLWQRESFGALLDRLPSNSKSESTTVNED